MATRPIGSAGGSPSSSVDAQIQAALNSDPEIVAAKSSRVGPVAGGKKRVVDDRPSDGERVTGGDTPRPRKAGRADYGPTHTAKPPKGNAGKPPRSVKDGPGRSRTLEESVRDRERAEKEDEFDRNLEKVLEDQGDSPIEDDIVGRNRHRGRGDVPEETEEAEVDDTEEEEPEESEEETDAELEEETEDEDAEAEQPKGKSKKLDLEKALRILRLEKWSTAALGKLTDEEKIQLASDRLEARRVTEAKLEAQAKELAELKQSRAAAKDDKAPESPEHSPATGERTFDARKIATRLKEGFGDETVEAVSEPIHAAVDYMEKRLEAARASFAPLVQMVVNQEIRSARNRLERVYPELDSDQLFDKVRARAQKLDWEAYEGDIDAIYHDAAAIVLGHKSQNDPRTAGRAARRRATPATGSRRVVGAPKTAHDAWGEIFKAFDAGDPELARQIHRSIA